MKHTRLPLLVLVVGHWLLGALSARAQTADPTFYPAEIYQPASTQDVLVLSTGSRLIMSAGCRLAEGVPSSGLVRYTAVGQPDAAFNSAVSTFNWTPVAVAEDAAGRLLVASSTNAQLGPQSYGGLVRLLPNGTPDPSFAPQQTINGIVSGLLAQPDGKIVLAGSFRSFGGQAIAGLVRLNVDGSIDQPFMTALGAGLTGQTTNTRLALQPDGKLVLGGAFVTVAGQARRALVRLNTDGSLDTSFAPPVLSTTVIGSLAVQPDGKIIVGTYNGTRLVANGPYISRLTSSGAIDATFAVPTTQAVGNVFGAGRNLVVLPNGSVLFVRNGGGGGQTRIVRLSSSGAVDNSWNTVPVDNYSNFTSLAPLPNGQVLAASAALRMVPASTPVGVSLLNTDGTYNASFVPLLRAAGSVQDVALQPDGKMLILGSFTEVNGLSVQNLTRLNPDGTPDATFSNLPLQTGSTSVQKRSVLVQPNGKILIAGDFTALGASPLTSIARLNADGTLDASFMPPFRPNSPTLGNSQILNAALQPDGNVVANGVLYFAGGNTQYLVRLLGSTGQLDPTFQPSYNYVATSLLVQPDGKLLLTADDGTALLRRLLPNGTADPTFTPTTSSDPYSAVFGLQRYPDGRLLVYGYFSELNGVPAATIARLLPNGTTDPTFNSSLNGQNDWVEVALLQPNQRVVFDSDFSGIGRELADGTRDFPFNVAISGPYQVRRIVAQPDGGLIFVGSFERIAGTPRMGIARILDANVLAVRPGQSAATLGAWPVPARTELHLRLEAAARPQHVQLLDALGRPVRTLARPAAEATLDVRGLPAGTYLLRVNYADGPATRRVVVE